MVNLVTAYFDTLLTQGDASIIGDILEPTIRCGHWCACGLLLLCAAIPLAIRACAVTL